MKCAAFSSACAADADALGRKGGDWDKVTRYEELPVLQSPAARHLISAVIDAALKKQLEEDIAVHRRVRNLGIERASVQRSGAGADELIDSCAPEHEERRRSLRARIGEERANRLGQGGGKKRRTRRRKL